MVYIFTQRSLTMNGFVFAIFLPTDYLTCSRFSHGPNIRPKPIMTGQLKHPALTGTNV